MKQMKTKILVSVVVAALMVVVACSKNTYNTKPTLKIKSFSTNVVQINQGLTFQLQVTDKEGDVTDIEKAMSIVKVRLNQKTTPITLRDTLFFKVPEAPNSTNGIIQFDLEYTNHLISAQDPNGQNDTLQLRFALKDKAGNVSDTVISDPIVIIR